MFNLRYFRASLLFLGSLIVSALLWMLLSSVNVGGSAQTSPLPSATPSQSPTPALSKREQWLGQWEVMLSQSPEQRAVFMLTPEGKLFLLPSDFPTGSPVALEMPIRKISEATTLPPNTQIFGFDLSLIEQGYKARQAEAKTNLGAMNRAQQAYFVEHAKFSRTIEDLGVGIKPESENYSYQILPQGNQTRSVMMTARAKRPKLRSYTGAVFVVNVENEGLTVAVVCETDTPSSTPPAMPAAPKEGSTEVQCPAGSRRLGVVKSP